MERARHRPQVMLSVMAETGESQKALNGWLSAVKIYDNRKHCLRMEELSACMSFRDYSIFTFVLYHQGWGALGQGPLKK